MTDSSESPISNHPTNGITTETETMSQKQVKEVLATISSFNLNELKEIEEKTKIIIANKQEEALVELKAKVADLANDCGFSVDDLLGRTRKMPGMGLEAKYRNPENPNETWSGRGKHPHWLRDFLADDGKIEDCLIKQPT